MGCCGSGSSEPKQKNNNSVSKANYDKNISSNVFRGHHNPLKNIFVWGLVILIIIGFLAMMF